MYSTVSFRSTRTYISHHKPRQTDRLFTVLRAWARSASRRSIAATSGHLWRGCIQARGSRCLALALAAASMLHLKVRDQAALGLDDLIQHKRQPRITPGTQSKSVFLRPECARRPLIPRGLPAKRGPGPSMNTHTTATAEGGWAYASECARTTNKYSRQQT